MSLVWCCNFPCINGGWSGEQCDPSRGAAASLAAAGCDGHGGVVIDYDYCCLKQQ